MNRTSVDRTASSGFSIVRAITRKETVSLNPLIRNCLGVHNTAVVKRILYVVVLFNYIACDSWIMILNWRTLHLSALIRARWGIRYSGAFLWLSIIVPLLFIDSCCCLNKDIVVDQLGSIWLKKALFQLLLDICNLPRPVPKLKKEILLGNVLRGNGITEI